MPATKKQRDEDEAPLLEEEAATAPRRLRTAQLLLAAWVVVVMLGSLAVAATIARGYVFVIEVESEAVEGEIRTKLVLFGGVILLN